MGAVNETWKPVVGYEGFYEVSNLGRVRAMFEGNHGQYKAGRILKTHTSKNGYVRIEFNPPSKKPKKRTVHTLVLEAFVGKRPEGKEVRHLDGVKSNNQVSNLAWGTHSENDQDQRRHGTRIMGERHPLSKLTNDDVLKIRALREQGLTLQVIANQFGIDQSNVAFIAKRMTWTHI